MPSTREHHRQAAADRYTAYKQLLAETGEAHAGKDWIAHFKELRSRQSENRRLTGDELKAYWTERFTAAQIYRMAAAIDSLSSEVMRGGA